MIKQLKKFLVKTSGVALIEFSFVVVILMFFTAAGVDVYSVYNLKTKSQDVLHNISLGISKSDLSQQTVNITEQKVIDMLRPYGNINPQSYRFDIHTARFERGALGAPITRSSGSLATSTAFTPCGPADLGLTGMLEEGFSDIISARLCINPERIQPSIFGGLIGDVFTKDTDLCQEICTLGQNTLPSHSDVNLASRFQGIGIPASLDYIHPSSRVSPRYYVSAACRMVIGDIPRYGPCMPGDTCSDDAVNYVPAGLGSYNLLSSPPGNAGGGGGCAGGEGVVIPMADRTPRLNQTLEIFNTCNAARGDNIDFGYDGPDDTRVASTLYEWPVYGSRCSGPLTRVCTPNTSTGSATSSRSGSARGASGSTRSSGSSFTSGSLPASGTTSTSPAPGYSYTCNNICTSGTQCAQIGTFRWAPKGACGEWRVVDTSRPDLRANGKYYTDDTCPHPEALTHDGEYTDACTRVLNVDSVTGLQTCDIRSDFVHHSDTEHKPPMSPRTGLSEWNRIRREMYMRNPHTNGYNGYYFWPGYRGTTHDAQLKSVDLDPSRAFLQPPVMSDSRPPDGPLPPGTPNTPNPYYGTYNDDATIGLVGPAPAGATSGFTPNAAATETIGQTLYVIPVAAAGDDDDVDDTYCRGLNNTGQRAVYEQCITNCRGDRTCINAVTDQWRTIHRPGEDQEVGEIGSRCDGRKIDEWWDNPDASIAEKTADIRHHIDVDRRCYDQPAGAEIWHRGITPVRTPTYLWRR